MKKINVVLLIGALAVAAAGKESAPPASRRTAEKEAMTNAMRALDDSLDAEERLAKVHQRTMVTPAPADFKPENAGRRVRLRLILEKNKVAIGSYPRFRLEMTNVGGKTINYQEYHPSIFVKNGRMIDSPTISFYLTDVRNKRKELMPVVFHSRASRAPSSTSFQVRLRPGETLHSIGDDDSPAGNFKTLDAKGAGDNLGRFRLQVELDDRPRPLTQGYIDVNLKTGGTLESIHEDHRRRLKAALGPASSNAAEFEVTR